MFFSRIILPRSPSRSFFVMPISTSNVSASPIKEKPELMSQILYVLIFRLFHTPKKKSNGKFSILPERSHLKNRVGVKGERGVKSHTEITVVDANKFNPLYSKNTIKFPLIVHLH